METISTLIGVGIVIYIGYKLYNGFYVAPDVNPPKTPTV